MAKLRDVCERCGWHKDVTALVCECCTAWLHVVEVGMIGVSAKMLKRDRPWLRRLVEHELDRDTKDMLGEDYDDERSHEERKAGRRRAAVAALKPSNPISKRAAS